MENNIEEDLVINNYLDHQKSPSPEFKLETKHTKKKFGFLEWILISMSLVGLITSIGLFIIFFIVDQVPSILLNENISKSLLDTRKYEMIRLLNGIEVLLINDPTTANSAASVTINSGIVDDAKYNIYGIGNLVKTVLINGRSKKRLNYLVAQSFGRILFDSYQIKHIAYSFDVGNENFIQSIEVFADIIKFRDINDSNDALTQRIERSVEIINDIYNRELRFNQESIFRKALWSILGEEKDYFPSGSKNTFLNKTFTIDDLTKVVLKYYKDNYRGSKMKIVVLSQLKIKEMKGIVIKLFSEIPQFGYDSTSSFASGATDSPIPQYHYNKEYNNDLNNNLLHQPSLPQANHDLGKIILMKLSRKSSSFRVVFFIDNIPFDSSIFFFTFLKYLFDDQRHGSLCYLLMKDNYIVKHYYKHDYLKNNTISVSFGFELTHNGLIHVDEVLYRVYNYFKFLRETKVNKELYEDLNKILFTRFLYKEHGVDHYSVQVETYGRNMFQFSDAITKLNMNTHFLPAYNQEFLETLVKLFVPRNSVVLFSLKHEAAQKGASASLKPMIIGDIDFKEDDVFNASFSVHSFKESILKRFEELSTYDKVFSFRQKNNYLTTLTSLVQPQSKEEETKRSPEKILEKTHIEMWHKYDRTFRLPKSHIHLILISPFFPSNESEDYYLLQFHYQYLFHAFYYEFSEAIEAGSNINILKSKTYRAIEIMITTFSDLFDRILTKALDLYYHITTSIISESLIKNLTESYFISYYKQPQVLRSAEFLQAAIKNNVTVALQPPLSYDSTDISGEINALLNQSYIRGLMYGNINRSNAERILLQNILPRINMDSTYYSKKFLLFNENELISYLLEKKDFYGNNIIRLKNTPNDKSTFVANFFYLGSNRNHREEMLILFIKQIMVSFFLELIKMKHYSYSKGFVLLLEDNYYFVVAAMDDNKYNIDPKTMCAHLDLIFTTVRQRLKLIHEDNELYNFKKNILMELNKKDPNLSERTKTVFLEIRSSRFQFDQVVEYTIEKLNKEFTLQNILEKFDSVFYSDVKRLSFQKNYTEEIDLRQDQYVLNKTVPTMVTDDIEYLHKKRK